MSLRKMKPVGRRLALLVADTLAVLDTGLARARDYMVDNRQCVLMPAGTTLTAFALAEC